MPYLLPLKQRLSNRLVIDLVTLAATMRNHLLSCLFEVIKNTMREVSLYRVRYNSGKPFFDYINNFNEMLTDVSLFDKSLQGVYTR